MAVQSEIACFARCFQSLFQSEHGAKFFVPKHSRLGKLNPITVSIDIDGVKMKNESIYKDIEIDIKNSLKTETASDIKYDIDLLKDEKFEIEFTRLILSGNQYFVPKYALHRPAVRSLLSGAYYEPKTHDFVEYFFKSVKGSMVHAGTFFGDMIPNFSKSVSAKVYAFEPVFENYILAKLCVDKNNLVNVILMNSALSDCVGNLYIDTNQDGKKHAGGASRISENGVICAAISIDHLNIEDLILIQLDVEGHELSALKGAQITIQKSRPAIAIEDNNNNCAKFLSSLNYEKIGRIPGLKIWTPNENNDYKEKIVSFLSK